MEKIKVLKTITKGTKKITYLDNGNIRVQSMNSEPSKTQQQFAAASDINNIMAKYKKTGEINFPRQNQGSYADLTQMKNYQQSLDTVIKAQEAFDTLPSDVRKKFQNNPAELLEFLGDPNNDEEAIKLGLKIQKQTAPNDETKTKKQNDDSAKTKKPNDPE